MEKTARFKIERDPGLKDGIEVTRRSARDYEIRVGEEVDLENNREARELFADRFNVAYRDQDIEKENALDAESRLDKVQMRRLNEAITKGEARFNFKIPQRY